MFESMIYVGLVAGTAFTLWLPCAIILMLVILIFSGRSGANRVMPFVLALYPMLCVLIMFLHDYGTSLR